MRNILIIIAIVVILGAIAYSFNKNDSEDGGVASETERVRPLDEKREIDSIVEDLEEDSVVAPSTSPGIYTDYDQSLLAGADSGDVVLFFHAGWCPTCKALDRNLNTEATNIPEDLSILKLDYDKSSDLKKKYDVVIQHTLVQVDSQGNEITKWVGGNDLTSIISRVK